MHIENVHIHLTGTGLTAAELAAALGFTPPSQPPSDPLIQSTIALPKIGDAWPGVDGVYAGLSRGENGDPDAHLVLLNAQPERDMNWNDAIAWAQGLGDGARLPSRFESALIYANLQDKVDTGRWHWTGTQYSSYGAWSQLFDDGSQGSRAKSYEARCRAVRRLIL